VRTLKSFFYKESLVQPQGLHTFSLLLLLHTQAIEKPDSPRIMENFAQTFVAKSFAISVSVYDYQTMESPVCTLKAFYSHISPTPRTKVYDFV